MTKSTKNNRRQNIRHPNLKKRYNLKVRQDYIDTHYINGVDSVTGEGKGLRPLNEEELDWLNKFYGEYVNASVNQKSHEDQLHNTEELVKDCYNKNNARNRCVMNKVKKLDRLKYESDVDVNLSDIDCDEDIRMLYEYAYEIFLNKKKKK